LILIWRWFGAKNPEKHGLYKLLFVESDKFAKVRITKSYNAYTFVLFRKNNTFTQITYSNKADAEVFLQNIKTHFPEVEFMK
jgi:hypothetical protein